jgi:predicted glutamine amidotransferase
MCLIIMQSAGAMLPAQAIENGWSHNDDGAGYMFVDDEGKLIIRKPFFKLKHLLRSYRSDWAICGARSPFVIHLRYATHGVKDETNTHPHSICGGKVGLVHNGVLSEFEPPFDSDISDTVHFCRTVLAYRRPEHVMDETFRDILANMIGTGNKFVLLSDTRAISIVNEKAGMWDGSNWFSNSTYRKAYDPPVRLPAAYWNGQSGFVPSGNGTLFGPPAVRAEHSAFCVCERCPAERPFPPLPDDEEDGELEAYARERAAGLDWDSMDDSQWRELELERELDRAIERDTR